MKRGPGTRPSRPARWAELAAALALAAGACGARPLPPGEWSEAFSWSGLRWRARQGGRAGPGANLWSARPHGVRVEGGELVLRARRRGRVWRSAEVAAALPAGPVRVRVLLAAVPALDPAMVAAVFLYRDDESELDFELSRWGNPAAPDAQLVVAPATPDRMLRFESAPGPAVVELSLGRRKVCSSYRSATGRARFCRRGPGEPSPDGHRLHINLWVRAGERPATEATLRVRDVRVFRR